MEVQYFESEYKFSVILPNSWSEYELDDEENTNGFFDTSEWTGNLRITAVKSIFENPDDFLKTKQKETKAEILNWEQVKGIYFSENSDNLYIYYWYLTENNRLYICSFTIDSEMENSEKNKNELKKVEKILKTIKTK